jgi:hypothetical protein
MLEEPREIEAIEDSLDSILFDLVGTILEHQGARDRRGWLKRKRYDCKPCSCGKADWAYLLAWANAQNPSRVRDSGSASGQVKEVGSAEVGSASADESAASTADVMHAVDHFLIWKKQLGKRAEALIPIKVRYDRLMEKAVEEKFDGVHVTAFNQAFEQLLAEISGLNVEDAARVPRWKAFLQASGKHAAYIERVGHKISCILDLGKLPVQRRFVGLDGIKNMDAALEMKAEGLHVGLPLQSRDLSTLFDALAGRAEGAKCAVKKQMAQERASDEDYDAEVMAAFIR